jgi:hypothetical protein
VAAASFGAKDVPALGALGHDQGCRRIQERDEIVGRRARRHVFAAEDDQPCRPSQCRCDRRRRADELARGQVSEQALPAKRDDWRRRAGGDGCPFLAELGSHRGEEDAVEARRPPTRERRRRHPVGGRLEEVPWVVEHRPGGEAGDCHPDAGGTEEAQLRRPGGAVVGADDRAHLEAETRQGERSEGDGAAQPPASGVVGNEVARRRADHEHAG